MKTVVKQLVVMGNGELRIPEGTSQVGHGHRSPDRQIKITMPANTISLLVEVEIELEEVESTGIGSRLPS
jgi:hypothetical protein